MSRAIEVPGELGKTASLFLPVFTVAEVAEMLQVSDSTVYGLIKVKRLAAFRVEHQWRISLHAIGEYLGPPVEEVQE